MCVCVCVYICVCVRSGVLVHESVWTLNVYFGMWCACVLNVHCVSYMFVCCCTGMTCLHVMGGRGEGGSGSGGGGGDANAYVSVS